MLNQIRTADPGSYFLGVQANYEHRSALYLQIFNKFSFSHNDIILEFSSSDIAVHQVDARIHLVTADPMGGISGLSEIDVKMTTMGRRDEIQPLPWADNSFSTVLCVGIFNLVEDHSAGLAEIHRLLAPEGRLIIADQWFRKTGPMFASLMHKYNRNSDSRIYSPAWVSRLLKSSGFSLIEIHANGATNFLCSASKIQ